jgi:predicted transcriptional regulator of viral defense system
MKNKLISTQSNQLLSYFIGQNINCFEYSQAFQALPESKGSAVRELLSDMTRRGLLMRLKEGIYYIIPYEEKAETFMPDWHLITGCMVKDTAHYIGYYSALQIHNLITQPSLKEQVVVSRQLRPAVIHIKKVPFQFIYHIKRSGLTTFIRLNVPILKKHSLIVYLNLTMQEALLKLQKLFTNQEKTSITTSFLKILFALSRRL